MTTRRQMSRENYTTREQNRQLLIDLFMIHAYKNCSVYTKETYERGKRTFKGENDKEDLIVLYKGVKDPIRIYDLFMRRLLPNMRCENDINTYCLQWCKSKCIEIGIPNNLCFKKKKTTQDYMKYWFRQFIEMETMFEYLEQYVTPPSKEDCCVCLELTADKTKCNHYLCHTCSQTMKTHSGLTYYDCPICRTRN